MAIGCIVVDGAASAQGVEPMTFAGGGLRGTGTDQPSSTEAFTTGASIPASSTPDSLAQRFRAAPSSNVSSTASSPTDPTADTALAPEDPAASLDAGGTRSAAAPPRSEPLPSVEPPPAPPGIAKPVKPIKQYGPKKSTAKHRLPTLQPYATAIRQRGQSPRDGADGNLQLRGGSTSTESASDLPPVNAPVTPPPTIAAVPLPAPRRKPVVDPNPYAPVGVGVGSLRLFPFVETDVGYDSNPDQTLRAAARPSAFTHVEGGTTLQSDWSRHSLSADLRGGYYDYFANHNADRPEASGVVNSRIDVTREMTLDSVGRFTVSTQRPGSPEIVLGQAAKTLTGRPVVYTYGGETGVTKRFNRFAVSLRGAIDHYGFEDATTGNGTVVPLSRDDYTAYTAKARLSYELTPGMTPFVEGFGGVRRYDSRTDASGTLRNSTGEGAKVGSTYEVTRLLTGEASVGYENRDYVDRRLRPLRGPLVDSSLVYRPTPLTTVTLKATSTLDETNIPLSSGASTKRVALELSHALFRNLTLTGLLAYQNVSYSGVKLNEDTFDIGLKAEYALSRSVVVRGSFTHERLKSDAPGLDYTQNVFLLGLRLQR